MNPIKNSDEPLKLVREKSSAGESVKADGSIKNAGQKYERIWLSSQNDSTEFRIRVDRGYFGKGYSIARWRWAPLKLKNGETILINVNSAAKRLHITKNEVRNIAAQGEEKFLELIHRQTQKVTTIVGVASHYQTSVKGTLVTKEPVKVSEEFAGIIDTGLTRKHLFKILRLALDFFSTQNTINQTVIEEVGGKRLSTAVIAVRDKDGLINVSAANVRLSEEATKASMLGREAFGQVRQFLNYTNRKMAGAFKEPSTEFGKQAVKGSVNEANKISLTSFTSSEETILNDVLDKAPSILGVDQLTIKEALSNLDNQKKIKEAFSSLLPGSPPVKDEDIDDLPRVAKGMTMRQIVLLGTLATILKVTDKLEAECIRSNKDESGSFGELIPVGSNRQLHVQKFGTPNSHQRCVIFESGGGSGGDSWGQVKELLKDSSYGLSYDRAGLWLFSDQSPNAGVLSQMSQDFERMLAKLEEKGEIISPYILVGHSLGGVLMQFYALNHPEKVVGLVLVDSSSDKVAEDPRMAPTFDVQEANDFHTLDHLMPKSTAEHLFPRARHTLTAHAEALHKKETLSHFGKNVKQHSGPLFGDTPLRVITRVKTDSSEIEEAWQEHQQNLTQRSLHSNFTLCKEGISHDIPNEAPEVVAKEILSISNEIEKLGI